VSGLNDEQNFPDGDTRQIEELPGTTAAPSSAPMRPRLLEAGLRRQRTEVDLRTPALTLTTYFPGPLERAL
jgi:hypothetical protein